MYTKVLEESSFPIAYQVYGSKRQDFDFMQDNAAVHTSREFKKFFFRLKINVFAWPMLSPDPNPIDII